MAPAPASTPAALARYRAFGDHAEEARRRGEMESVSRRARPAELDTLGRYANDLDLEDLFLFEARRKVQKDRTVSLDGVHYEVDAVLVDEKVTLRFEPNNRKTVQVVFDGRRYADAKPVNIHANCHVKRDRPGVSYSAFADEEER